MNKRKLNEIVKDLDKLNDAKLIKLYGEVFISTKKVYDYMYLSLLTKIIHKMRTPHTNYTSEYTEEKIEILRHFTYDEVKDKIKISEEEFKNLCRLNLCMCKIGNRYLLFDLDELIDLFLLNGLPYNIKMREFSNNGKSVTGDIFVSYIAEYSNTLKKT